MKRSRAVSVQIAKPFDEVYAFLAEPLNFTQWGPVSSDRMTHIGGRDYLIDVPRGEVVIRSIERNSYGVLDFWTFLRGDDPGPATSCRLVPNEEGCEITVLWLQREGEDDVKFNSEVDWLTSDLGVLKSLLEA